MEKETILIVFSETITPPEEVLGNLIDWLAKKEDEGIDFIIYTHGIYEKVFSSQLNYKTKDIGHLFFENRETAGIMKIGLALYNLSLNPEIEKTYYIEAALQIGKKEGLERITTVIDFTGISSESSAYYYGLKKNNTPYYTVADFKEIPS